MKVFFQQPLLLLALLVVPLVLALALSRLRAMNLVRRRAAVALRATIMVLAILALAQPSLTRPDESVSVVYVVDESDSTNGAFREAAADWLRRSLELAGPNDRTAVVRFGRHASVDRAATPASVDGSATNLDEALRLARDLVPKSGGRRIVLLTDGWENVGSAQDAATEAVPPGVQVTFVAPASAQGPEVAVRTLDAPVQIRDGAPFEAAVVVDSALDTSATLRLFVDGRPAAEQAVRLAAGPNRFTLGQRARALGLRRLRVEVQAPADTRPDNNAAEAVTAVKEAGRVLLLEGRQGEAAHLTDVLREGGLEVEVAAPNSVPPRADGLDRYDAVGLVNVAATQLALDQQRTLEQYVQTMGRGLFVAGGNTSFALGGYSGTILDDVLPVSPAPPTRREQGSVALFLVIDKSGSMDLYRSDASKMAMAREAAILATEALRPGDTLGVLAFDVRHQWAVSPIKISGPEEIRAAQSRIASIRADGGTSIFPALEEAYKAAAQSDAKLKHIILLTDGQSFDADYAGLINRMRPAQITLSTIAIGADSDTKLLTTLAQIGAGRYYFTERAQDIPKIATKETTIVTRSALVEGRVVPRLVESSPVMLGLTGGELPTLQGYVATTSRSRAHTVLSTDRGDPLLAHWHYGLGRVVAWTSDATGAWSADWQAWADGPRFWQQAVRWTMPEPSQAGFQVGVTVAGDQVTFRVNSVRPDGRFADLLDTRVTVVTPSGEGRELAIPQAGPGAYSLTTTAPRPGAYEARFSQQDRGGVLHQESIGFTVSGPAELRSVGINRSLLNRVVARSGGRELHEPADPFARDLPAGGERGTPLWPWLATAAILLFPLDVAIRRFRFGPS